MTTSPTTGATTTTEATPGRAPAPSTPAAPGRLPSLLSTSLARTRMELRSTLRQRDAVIFNLAFPVIFLFIFGSVFGDDVAPGISFTQYFTAGMAASGILLVSFQSLAISIAVERDDGTLKRLEGTPMPRAAYFLGKVGLVVVTGGAQLAVLLAAARLAFDVPLPDTAQRWWTLAWVAVLGAAAGTLLGIAYSSIPSSGSSASAVVAPVVLVLQFISGVFFVYSQLPGWMQDVAAVFPLKWLAQGFRAALLPDSMAAAEVGGGWELGTTALVLVAWTVVGLVLCRTTFRWRRRSDR